MTAIVIHLDEARAARRVRAGVPQPLPQPPRDLTIAEAIRFCLSHPELISAWESEFLVSIRGRAQWGIRLSPKQLRVLGNILDKVERAEAGQGRAR
jgi:hypothetical protein